jgi:hypothetical protein
MKHALAALSLMLVAASLCAITAKVVDTDGPATVQRVSGKAEKVAIGKSYTTGDSIRTGKNGLVEMSQEGLTIRVGPSTVFTLMEKEQGGKPKGVLAVTLGSVKMKYDRLTGSEPLIQSASCIAGVRGTELTVWAGTDGASQLIVDSGLVTVEAFGKTVELGPDEAVVVVNGQQPGEKFVVQRGLLDHAKWDQGRVETLLADPPAALAGLRERLRYYAVNASDFRVQYQDSKSQLDAERQKVKQIEKENGLEAAQAYEREHVAALITPTQNLFLNARYFLLAAFSMRRFVGSRMYLLLKTSYVEDPGNPAWTGFLEGYRLFLDQYESQVAPFLVEADF